MRLIDADPIVSMALRADSPEQLDEFVKSYAAGRRFRFCTFYPSLPPFLPPSFSISLCVLPSSWTSSSRTTPLPILYALSLPPSLPPLNFPFLVVCDSGRRLAQPSVHPSHLPFLPPSHHPQKYALGRQAGGGRGREGGREGGKEDWSVVGCEDGRHTLLCI